MGSNLNAYFAFGYIFCSILFRFKLSLKSCNTKITFEIKLIGATFEFHMLFKYNYPLQLPYFHFEHFGTPLIAINPHHILNIESLEDCSHSK